MICVELLEVANTSVKWDGAFFFLIFVSTYSAPVLVLGQLAHGISRFYRNRNRGVELGLGREGSDWGLVLLIPSLTSYATGPALSSVGSVTAHTAEPLWASISLFCSSLRRGGCQHSLTHFMSSEGSEACSPFLATRVSNVVSDSPGNLYSS